MSNRYCIPVAQDCPGQAAPTNCTMPCVCGFLDSSSTAMCAVPSTAQEVRRPNTADESGEFAKHTGSSPGALVAVTFPPTGSKSEQSGSTGFSTHGSLHLPAKRRESACTLQLHEEG